MGTPPKFRQVTPEEIEFCRTLETVLTELGRRDPESSSDRIYQDDRIFMYWHPTNLPGDGLSPAIFEVRIIDPLGKSKACLNPYTCIVLRLSLSKGNTGRVEYHRPGQWQTYINSVLFHRANEAIRDRKETEEKQKKWENDHYGPIDDHGIFCKYVSLTNDEFLKVLE